MPGEAWEFDAAASGRDGEDPGTALALTEATGYNVMEQNYAAPPLKRPFATSADTEGSVPVGEAGYENREITLTLRVSGTTFTLFNNALRDLQHKVGKVNREGGTLKRTLSDGVTTVVFDLVNASFELTQGNRFIHSNRTEVKLSCTARPHGRGPALTLADNVETTLPALVFTAASLKGDLPALGKLVVDNDEAASDYNWLAWGVQSRHYSSATTAKLFYEAEDLTPLGTAALNAGPTGASGGGANKTIFQGTLTTGFAAMLSTQAAGAGAHLSHVGDFRVFARVQSPTANTGGVQVRLEWGEADLRRFTQNDPVNLYPDSTNLGAWEGTWRLVDLGQVHLSKVPQGTQRWEGRVLAKSTVAGDDLHVDCLMFVPVTEGYGEARSVAASAAVTTYSARDEFDQTAGALAGKQAPVPSGVPGQWVGAGDADDFTVETTGKTAQRTAVSDAANTGRYATLDVNLATCEVGVTAKSSAQATVKLGVLARYIDASNWLLFYVQESAKTFFVAKRVAGTISTLVSGTGGFAVNTYTTLVMRVTAGGVVTVWRDGIQKAQTQDPDLVTAGALATGDVGIYDENTSATAATRNYGNFYAHVPALDAAMFATQSLELRHDRVIREDSGGTLWTPVSKYEGDYLTISPAAREARTARFILIPSTNDPLTGAHAFGDISGRLTYTPRYLHVPGV